jgi:hypothetical protein
VGEVTREGVNDGVGWTVTVVGVLQNVTKLIAESEKGRMSQRLIFLGVILRSLLIEWRWVRCVRVRGINQAGSYV